MAILVAVRPAGPWDTIELQPLVRALSPLEYGSTLHFLPYLYCPLPGLLPVLTPKPASLGGPAF